MERYKDCYYRFTGNRLAIGNDCIERCFDLNGSVPVTVSLLDKRTGDEWFSPNASIPMFRLPIRLEGQKPAIKVAGCIDDDTGIGREHLLVSLELAYAEHQLRLDTRIYPGTAVMRHMIWVKAIEAADHAVGGSACGESIGRTGADGNGAVPARLDGNNRPKNAPPEDYIDAISCRDIHCCWTATALRDRTDINNNLVSEVGGLLYPNERRWAQGNVLRLTKTLREDSGLLWLKESPTRFGQLHYGEGDYRMMGKQLYMAGTGLQPEDVTSSDYVAAYGSAVGLFQGTEYDALALLHQYHRCVREYKAERDTFIMSNTWGDRSRDGRVGEAFVLSELPVAAELGITHYQIDDGWQQGITSNSVEPGGTWGDYYSGAGDFWSVHKERFPNGLEPVVAKANECGISLGLWFSPDSSQDFVHWKSDAEKLLELYQRFGIRYFKLDGIDIRSKRGERNLLKLMQKVVRESTGAVYFNQDTTAGTRLGYYGQTQYGGLFLENRYTDWTNYYPHWTLRNLWMLAKYVPAQKLQMEFLNAERNAALYKDDPLAPSRCGIAYAFAVAMFANPLAWMEVTGLSEASRQVLGSLIAAYKKVQPHIMSGHILPIGEEPSGISWTGFQSIVSDKEGYVLLLREWNRRDVGRFRLWNVPDKGVTLRCLFCSQGTGAGASPGIVAGEQAQDRILSLDPDGVISCRLNEPFAFALYHYSLSGA